MVGKKQKKAVESFHGLNIEIWLYSIRAVDTRLPKKIKTKIALN